MSKIFIVATESYDTKRVKEGGDFGYYYESNAADAFRDYLDDHERGIHYLVMIDPFDIPPFTSVTSHIQETMWEALGAERFTRDMNLMRGVYGAYTVIDCREE